MSDQPPAGVVQATGRVAEKIVNGFSSSPAMLLIVILNVALLGMAGYALVSIAKLSAEGRTQITSLLQACIASKEDHTP